MKKYLIIIAFLPMLVIAQNNGDSLKFDIIKASIKFLATDTVWHIKKVKPLSCKFSDYSCLKKFCDDNKILNAGGYIDSWSKNAISYKSDLLDLNKKILNDLTKDKKAYRKKLTSYNKYEKEIANISESYKEVQKEKVEEKEVEESVAETPVVENKEEKLDTEPRNNDSVGNSVVLKDESNTPLYSLILSIIAIVIAVIGFLKSKLSSEINVSNKRKIDELKSEISDLRSKLFQNNKTNDSPRNFDDKMKSIEEKLNYLENSRIENERVVPEKKIETIASNVINNAILNYTAFAKIPDLDNGFSKSILLTSQNGEQIYEIQINGDRATYKISSDANSQKYALSDFNYYLSNACEFLNQPVKSCKIFTVQEGTLIKSSGNWIIQNKARIEFK